MKSHEQKKDKTRAKKKGKMKGVKNQTGKREKRQ
jgi:hypothetical protein